MSATAKEVQNKDPETGKLLPGNVWRYKPGTSGRVARFTYKSISHGIREYVQDCGNTESSYTWAGLALYLGITRKGLDGYRHSTVKSADPDKIAAILAYYETILESQREAMLTDRSYATQGVIRGLQALDREKWGDKQTVDIAVQQQISIALDPDSQLAKRLNSAGVTIDQHPDALE